MPTHNKWLSLGMVSGVLWSLVGLLVCVGGAEEASPRVGCGCGQGAAGASNESPTPTDKESQTFICPQYVWMDWGNYCSYYAQVHTFCDPVNLDHENCSLPIGDCGDPQATNCVGVRLELLERGSPLVGGKLGSTGYPGGKATKRAEGAPLPGGSPHVAVTKIDSFIIKFRVRGNDAAYAQIFIAKVAPKPPSQSPPAVLARGLEIGTDGLFVNEIRHDYTTTPPGGTHVHKQPPVPVQGQGRQFLYQYGPLTIPIILHRDTPGHGQ